MGIEIDKKPPERGWRSIASRPMSGGACCCCCCCCLHSLGGVIGALTAPVKPLAPTELPRSSIEGRNLEPKTSATGLYFAIVSIMCAVIIAMFAASDHESPDAAAGALIAAIFLPAAQLAASFVAALIITFSNRIGKEARMQHLMKITWRAFIGALIGTAIMIPLVLH